MLAKITLILPLYWTLIILRLSTGITCHRVGGRGGSPYNVRFQTEGVQLGHGLPSPGLLYAAG